MHKALCSDNASKTCAGSKDEACDAGHSALVEQRTLCSASPSKSCINSKDETIFFSVVPFILPFVLSMKFDDAEMPQKTPIEDTTESIEMLEKKVRN